MPSALLRPCSAPGGCPELVEHGLCAKHAKANEQRRGTAASRGYGYRWGQYSAAWLRRHPLCGERADGELHDEHSRCAQEGRTTQATLTDHIVAVNQGGAFWQASNHQSLCASCHGAKDGEGRFGR